MIIGGNQAISVNCMGFFLYEMQIFVNYAAPGTKGN